MKKTYTFPRGIHPPQSKLTAAAAIEELPAPDRVIVPLIQHIGAPAKSLVKADDQVQTGQKIGEAGGFVSAAVHASISGKVAAIGPQPHPLGREVPAITIEADGSESWFEGTNTPVDWKDMGPADLRERVQEAGLTGMGGASFPSHVKLSPPSGKHIDTLILNGAECEPFLTADHRIMLENAPQIVDGLRILMRILDVSRAWIAIERNKPDAIASMQNALSGVDGAEVAVLKTKYPQGGEKQLIQAITGRQVPSGGLPMDCGCVVHNVGTALAVADAVAQSLPLLQRVVTVTGSGVKEPKNLRIRVGTPFRNVLDACGGLTDDCAAVISGGPMMGMAQYSLDVPVVKATSGILCLTQGEIENLEPGPCLSCGACLRACPIRLMPTWIVKNVELRRWEETDTLGALDCIECGSCSYVCPSKINLVQHLKWAKLEVTALRKKAKAAAG